MTSFEIILVILLTIIASSFIIMTIKGKFVIRIERHVTERKELDPLQLEIAKANLAEIQKYNDGEKKNAEDTQQHIKAMTEALQDVMGVNDETERQG